MEFLIVNFIVLILLLFLGTIIFIHHRSARMLLELVGHTKIGYIRFKYKNGTILDINEGMIGILDLALERHDLIGRDIREFFIFEEDEMGVEREIFRDKEKLINSTYHFKTLSGQEKWVLHNSQILRDPYTGERIIQVLAEDITREKESYRDMVETEERYEKLFKHSGDMVFLYDHDDKVIEEVNPVTEIITGYGSEELVGRPFESLVHPAYRKVLADKHAELLISDVVRLEVVIVCKDGTYKEGWLTLSTFEIKKKKIILTVVKDISELVREREEQKRRRSELEHFCAAAMEREERIRELRRKLERAGGGDDGGGK